MASHHPPPHIRSPSPPPRPRVAPFRKRDEAWRESVKELKELSQNPENQKDSVQKTKTPPIRGPSRNSLKYDVNDPFCDVDIIYIVRHGLREDQLRDPKSINLPTGIPGDSPLADPEGLQQARSLAAFFLHLPPSLRPSQVYSSGFYRTIQTASYTCQLLNIPLRVERGLGEWYPPERNTKRRPAHIPHSTELFGLLNPNKPELGTLVEGAYLPQVVPSKHGETKRDMWLRCRRSARLLIEQHSFYGSSKYEDEWELCSNGTSPGLNLQKDDPPVRLLWVCHGASTIMMNSLLVGGDWKLQGEISTGSLTVFQRMRQDRPSIEDLELEYRLGAFELENNLFEKRSKSHGSVTSLINPIPKREIPHRPPSLDLDSKEYRDSATRRNPFPLESNPNLVDIITAAFGQGYREASRIEPNKSWIDLCSQELSPLESGTPTTSEAQKISSAADWTLEQVDPQHILGKPSCYKEEEGRLPSYRGKPLEFEGVEAMKICQKGEGDLWELDPHHILTPHEEPTDPNCDLDTHVPSSWSKVDTLPLPLPLALRNWHVTLYDSLGHVYDQDIVDLARKNSWKFPLGEVGGASVHHNGGKG